MRSEQPDVWHGKVRTTEANGCMRRGRIAEKERGFLRLKEPLVRRYGYRIGSLNAGQSISKWAICTLLHRLGRSKLLLGSMLGYISPDSPSWSAAMPRNRRADFFEEIEQIEQVLNQLLEAERDAFRRMMVAPAGPAKSAALNSYRRAAAAQKKAIDRRQMFLEKNRP